MEDFHDDIMLESEKIKEEEYEYLFNFVSPT